MALRTFVKVSQINNLTDARYCAGMYVNCLGFNLEVSNEDYISPEKYKEITDWLSGVSFVAEFSISHPESILKKLESYSGIDSIEVSEEIHLPMLLNTGFSLIFKVIISDSSDLKNLITKASSYKENEVKILLDSSMEYLEQEMIQDIKLLSEKTEVILGFGFSPENLEQILENTGIYGIALKGGKEISPGLRDFDEMADILELLEVED